MPNTEKKKIWFNRLLNPESPPFYLDFRIEKTLYLRVEVLIIAIRCTSPLLLQFHNIVQKSVQTDRFTNWKCLCSTIAGLSVLSDVYEIELRFVSADGFVIF